MNTPKQYPHTCPLSGTDTDNCRIGTTEHIKGQGEPVVANEFLSNAQDRLTQINAELMQAFETMSQFPESITFYGSARLQPGTPYYEKARVLAARCCQQGFGVVTGGGPGIMQAANQGTNESCGSAIGFNIILPFEQSVNPYVTHGVDFQYFFTRKFTMNYSGSAYLCFPGGFGTLDEFFEIITLVQTKKIPRVPIILVGSEFWNPIFEYSKNILLEQFGTISAEDMDLFQVLDDDDEIMQVIGDAPPREANYD